MKQMMQWLPMEELMIRLKILILGRSVMVSTAIGIHQSFVIRLRVSLVAEHFTPLLHAEIHRFLVFAYHYGPLRTVQAGHPLGLFVKWTLLLEQSSFNFTYCFNSFSSKHIFCTCLDQLDCL